MLQVSAKDQPGTPQGPLRTPLDPSQDLKGPLQGAPRTPRRTPQGSLRKLRRRHGRFEKPSKNVDFSCISSYGADLSDTGEALRVPWGALRWPREVAGAPRCSLGAPWEVPGGSPGEPRDTQGAPWVPLRAPGTSPEGRRPMGEAPKDPPKDPPRTPADASAAPWAL